MSPRQRVTLTDEIDKILGLSEDHLESLYERAFKIGRQVAGNKIGFYAPGMVHYDTEYYTATNPYRFPSVSITGAACSLNCEHCNGQLLSTMIPAQTPEELWRVLQRVKDRGGAGCLISGGSTHRGDVPIANFVQTIARAKRELGLSIVVHTGVVYPETVQLLAEAGIDGAMLDIIGSDDTIREICHLDLKAEAFDRSMQLLDDYGVPMMPHIVVGLHYGRLHGEANAIRMIAKHRPDSVIVVAFKPLDGTPMVNTTPPSPVDIAKVMLAIRLTIPDVPLILGCARPHGEHRRTTDILALKSGANGIAYPTEEAYEMAEKMGLEIVMSDKCCSLVAETLR